MLQKLDRMGMYEESDIIMRISQNMILKQMQNRITLLEQKLNELENQSSGSIDTKKTQDFDLQDQPQDISINL